MRRLNVLSISLMALAIASITAGTALAQDTPRSSQPPSIQDVLIILEREEPPLGSRGDLCAISPGLLGETDMVWNDRPLFAWRGEAGQIILRSLNSAAPLWQQPLTGETQSIAYPDAPLTPGQVYEWELDTVSSVGPQYTFEIMTGEERDRVSQDLQALENQLKAAGESTEAIAIARAHYFAEQRLWSDAIQSLQSVTNPSSDLTQGITQMTNYLCGITEE